MNSSKQKKIFNEMNRGRHYRRRRRVLGVMAIALVLVVLSGSFLGYKALTKKSQNVQTNKKMENLATVAPQAEASKEQKEEEAKPTIDPAVQKQRTEIKNALKKNAKNVESKYVCLLAEDGTVLYGRKQNEKMNPASMTKLMTALLTVENVTDYNKTAVVSQETIDYTLKQDASVAGFEVGEKAKLMDLLYGVMLPSGADCCRTLEEAIAGSNKAFIGMMNDRAKELGLTNTHFTNSSGLTEKNHYSSAQDMAVLLSKCVQDDTLTTVMEAKKHDVKKTNIHKKGFTFYSTVYPKFANVDMTGVTYLGGKTGYTDEAGYCLASAVEINDQTYFLVTAGGRGDKTISAKDAAYVFKTIYNKTKAKTKTN